MGTEPIFLPDDFKNERAQNSHLVKTGQCTQ
jgi:hypothetical protein